MKINNWTLLILFAALILAAFIPQWLTAQNPDVTELRDGAVSAGLIAAILAIFKTISGKGE